MSGIILTANTVSLFFVLIMLYASIFEVRNPRKKDRVFAAFVATNAFLLFIDTVSWIFDGRTDLPFVLHATSLITLFGCFPATILFARYLYLHISGYTKVSGLYPRILYAYTILAVIVNSVLTIQGKLYYYENGIYREGTMYGVYLLSVFIMYIYILAYAFLYFKYMPRHDRIAFLAYALAPILVLAVNLIEPELSVNYPASAVSIVLIYVMLQSEQQQQAHARETVLVERSNTDELTGLRNRRAYTTACATVPQEENVGAAFIDCNGLKYINDTAGHEAGDKLLLRLTELLLDVFPRQNLFRISGDEFVILSATGENIWNEKIDVLISKIRKEDFEIAAVGHSWGKGSDLSYLLAQAEDKMYIAKSIFHRSFPDFVRQSGMFIRSIPSNTAGDTDSEDNSPILLADQPVISDLQITRRTILLAESNDNNRTLLTKLLSSYYDIIEASDTQTTIDTLDRYSKAISLALIDVHPRVIDGAEILQFRKENPHTIHVPVIITANELNRQAEVSYLQLGAAEYLRKPFSPDMLLDRIRQTIELVESVEALSAVEYDELTGIYTRPAFNHHAQSLINRDYSKGYSLCMIDIQEFHMVNRQYGEAKADTVLQHIGKQLKSTSDDHTIVGRYGNDQFLYLSTYQDDLKQKLDRMLKGMEDSSPLPDITIKCGIYDHIDTSLTMNVICDRALAAVRSAKHQYGIRIASFDADIERELSRQIQLENDMEKALEAGDFRVFYQPKHDAQTGKLAGAEALIRWEHPQFGFLSPGEFIPLFEKNGFITEADRYVWKHTCENLRKWIDKGLTVVPISVNASKMDLTHPDHLKRIDEVTRANRLSPDLLQIEVTESLFTDKPAEFIRMLNSCRERGYKIELDDFGSGYSSLNTLSSLPIDVVKMDILFVRQAYDNRGIKVLTSCIAMAKSLGFSVVCEGVETMAQSQLVRETQCDLVQGYYYSRPLNEKDFEDYLRKSMEQN